MSEEPWYADVVFPMLLAAARRRYGREIRDALANAGFTDMPRAGARLVGGIARNGPSLADAAADLAVSKQAASQLVDTLVLRSYLERRSDPDDRRRIVLDLTERGRAAAAEIRAAVDRVDQRWVDKVGADKVAETRRVLAALVEDGDAHFAGVEQPLVTGDWVPSSAMQPSLDLIGIVVTDMARALAFYRALGLPIPPEADAAPHVDVELPGGLRVAFDTVDVIRSFDPTYERPPAGRNGFVPAFLCGSPADVDALYEQLTAAGHTGHKEPWDAFWGQRYAEVLDPDGNLIDLFAPLA